MSFVTADEASIFCQISQNELGPVTLFKQMQIADNDRIPFDSFRNEPPESERGSYSRGKNTTVKTGNIRETGTQKHVLDSLKTHKNESDSYHQLTARGHSKLKYGN